VCAVDDTKEKPVMDRRIESEVAYDTDGRRSAAAPPAAREGEYVVDVRRTTLGFRAKAFCLKWVTGNIRPTSGKLRIKGGAISGEGAADATSVDTKLRPRDWHLRTSHYLHTTKYPEIRFGVDSCRLDSGSGQARLEVRDRMVTVPVTIDEFHISGGELRLKVSGSFDRRSLGMLPRQAGVSRVVRLNLDIVATRTAP
jgi:polyisoprenoid-binding protein YceI